MPDTVQNYSIGTFSWGSPIVFFVWGLPYSSNRHVTPVSVRDRKGLTCSIRAPPCPRFDTLRQSVSNRAQLFLAVYTHDSLGYSARGLPKRRGAHARDHAARTTAAGARGRPVTTRHMRVSCISGFQVSMYRIQDVRAKIGDLSAH